MGCLSYKTWSLVVGWLSLVTAAVFGFSVIFNISVLQKDTFLGTYVRSGPIADLRYLYIYITPVLVLEFIFAVMLIRGVHQQRRKLIAPHIILSVLYLLFIVVFSYYSISSFLEDGDEFTAAIEPLMQYLLIFLLGLVPLFPVCKFYKQLGRPIILSTIAATSRPVIVNKTYDVRGTAAASKV